MSRGDQTEAEKETLQSDLEKERSKTSYLESQLASAVSRGDQTEAEKETLQLNLEAVIEKLKLCESDMYDSKKRTGDLQASNELLVIDMAEEARKLAEAEEKWEGELEKARLEINRMQNEFKDLEAILTKSQELNTKLHTEKVVIEEESARVRATLHDNIQNSDALLSDINNVRDNLMRSENAREAASKELSQMSEQMSLKEDLIRDLESGIERLQDVVKENEKAFTEIERLRQFEIDATSLREKLTTVTTELHSVSSVRDDLEKRNALLVDENLKVRTERDLALVELDDTRANLQMITLNYENARDSLSGALTDIAGFRNELQESNSQIRELHVWMNDQESKWLEVAASAQEENNALKNEVKNFKAECKARQNVAEALQEEVVFLKETCESIERDFEDLCTENLQKENVQKAKLDTETHALKTMITELEVKVQNQSDTILSLQTALGSEKDAGAFLRIEIDTLNSENNDKIAAIEGMELQKKSMEEALTKAETDLQQKEKELEVALISFSNQLQQQRDTDRISNSEELHIKAEEVNGLEQKISELEREREIQVSFLQEECSSVKISNEHLRLQLQKALCERDGMEQSLISSKKKIDEYEHEVRELNCQMQSRTENLATVDTPLPIAPKDSLDSADHINTSSPYSSDIGVVKSRESADVRGSGDDEVRDYVDIRIQLEKAQEKIYFLTQQLENVQKDAHIRESLPPGWIQLFDTTSQRPYFVELSTGQSHWELPETVIAATTTITSSSRQDDEIELANLYSQLEKEKRENDEQSRLVQDLESTIFELRSALDDARRTVGVQINKSHTETSLDASLQEVLIYKDEIAKLREELSRVNADGKFRGDDSHELQSAQESLTSIRLELESTKSFHHQADQRRTQVEQDLALSEQKNMDLEVRNSALQSEVEILKQALLTARETLVKLDDAASDIEQEEQNIGDDSSLPPQTPLLTKAPLSLHGTNTVDTATSPSTDQISISAGEAVSPILTIPSPTSSLIQQNSDSMNDIRSFEHLAREMGKPRDPDKKTTPESIQHHSPDFSFQNRDSKVISKSSSSSHSSHAKTTNGSLETSQLTVPTGSIIRRMRKGLLGWLYPDAHDGTDNLGNKLEAYFDKSSGRWVFPDEEASDSPPEALAPPPTTIAINASTSNLAAAIENEMKPDVVKERSPRSKNLDYLMAPPPIRSGYSFPSMSSVPSSTGSSPSHSDFAPRAPSPHANITSVPQPPELLPPVAPGVKIWSPNTSSDNLLTRSINTEATLSDVGSTSTSLQDITKVMDENNDNSTEIPESIENLRQTKEEIGSDTEIWQVREGDKESESDEYGEDDFEVEGDVD